MNHPTLRELKTYVEGLENRIEAQMAGMATEPFLASNEAARMARAHVGQVAAGRGMRRASGDPIPEAQMLIDAMTRPVPPGTLRDIKALIDEAIMRRPTG